MKAASGKAKIPEASDAIAVDNNHAVSTEIMSNAELCAKRAPEEASYTVEDVKLSGEIVLAAKSVCAVVIK